MKVPKSSFVDEIQLQKALALILCDVSTLLTVPILPEVKLLEESELLVDALWTLPRTAFTITTDGWQVNQNIGPGGLTGGGVLVEMPEMQTNSPGVSGPVATWTVGIVGFSEPNTAFLTGTGIGYTSSQLCQLALDTLHNLNIYGLGTFVCDDRGIQYARDWVELKPGVSAHRVTLKAVVGRVQSTRSVSVVTTFAGGSCTLTCSDNTATIYFTTDGTPPTVSNPSTQTYTGPFAVTSGQTVIAGSEVTGKIISQLNGNTAP